MEVLVIIPDDVAASLQSRGDIPRQILESLAIDGIKAGKLTAYQVQKMLGFVSRFEVDGFLKERGVFFDYSPEDLQQELETIQRLNEARSS